MVCHCENCDLRDVKEKIKKIRNHQRAVESQKMSLKSQMTTLLKEKRSFEEEQGQKLVSSDALAVEVLHSRQFQSFCHLLTDI